jgi:hypothetical protein
VGGNPLDAVDLIGACPVAIAGITMDPQSQPAFTSLQNVGPNATDLGAVVGYPYAGRGRLSSFADGLKTGNWSGSSEAGQVALAAIRFALSTNAGAIDLITYSGGAGASTWAYNQLSQSEQARIGNILHVSPGANGDITAFSDTTEVVRGNEGIDPVAMVGTQYPFGIATFEAQCPHTSFGCLISAQAVQSMLASIKSHGPCAKSGTFTRGAGGGDGGGYAAPGGYLGWSILDILGTVSAGIPNVKSTFKPL